MSATHTLPNLPPTATFDVLHTLRTSLPPPAPGTEGSLEARIETAMAAVAAYHPADIAEALLAAQIVAANAQAMDCLRSPSHRTPMRKPPAAAAPRPPP